jgi:antirestriction protein
MSSQAVMKRQILALAKREPSNEELQKIKQSLAVYKKLTKEEQTKINEMVNDAHAKLDSEGKFAKGGKTKTQSMKTALTEFKNKIGIKKFKRATTGTDIKKDIGIPAQKVGKRIVRKKGKTTNQYGTFKNQVGTTYYEGRPNRSDVNQPSEKRKIKLADGGTTTSLSSIKRKYLKNEDENAHSENVVLLAKHFGDAEDLKLAKQILAKHNKEGHLSSENAKERNELHFKLIEKARAKFGEEGIEFAKGGEVGSEHEFVVTFQNSETGKLLKLNVLGTDEKNAIENAYMESEFNEPYEVYSVKKFSKGGEVSQYIDGLSKQEVLSKSIVYDNGGESYDRYTIFTPDGSVYGMSETAEGFNQYVGDSSEIEKGKHLGRKLRSVPKGIQSAVLDRMLDDEQMFAKGGKLSKEDALQKAIDMGVDFDKDFHAQSVGNELAELAKESGYKKSASSSGSTGRAFFYHLQKIYDKRKYAQGGKLSSKAKYIPKRDIAEIEIEKNGKSKSIDGANLLDGVYVKKGTKFADGGMMNANEHFRLRGLEFLKDDLAQLQQAVQDNNQEEIQKFFSYWGQHLEMLKTTNNERMFSFLQDDLMKLENDIEEKNQEEIEKFFSYWGYHLQSLKYAKGGTIKKSLAEFKNKVGASKYREATRGVDIKADLQIPALKKGRRVVTTKGKTSNQYGTFKNQVGSVYYENRPNHYDVNQPSEKRKIKLADGGTIGSNYEIAIFWKGLKDDRFIGKFIVSSKTLDKLEEEYKNILNIDVLDESNEKPISYNFLENKIAIKGKERGFVRVGARQYAQGGTFANGGVLEGAKIYVADLAEYNDGRLVGKWFDLSDYSDASELMEAIQEMLDEQTAKDKHGEVHEEWAVHDFEGFPRSFYSEYMGEKDFEKLYQIADVANDRGIPIDVLMEAVADFGADEDQIEEIADAYYGSVSTNFGNEFKDFAYEYIDSVGGFEGVSNSDFYFDFDSFGSDARMDYTDEELEEYGYDELDDTELGERLVDEMGGVDQLGQKTIEMYFDYDKFGRDLEHDFISVKGDDGDYYFFNRNW